MDDNERVNQANISRNWQKIHPRSHKFFGFFTKTTTKLGIVATKTSLQLKQFLHKELVIPPTPEFLNRITNPIRKEPVQKEKEVSDLNHIVKRSHEVLARAVTVFPFTLFPDTITVDRTKVTIHRRNFFFVSDVLSIRIEDVLNVSSGVGPLFGSVTVASRVMSTEDHFTINFFWRDDAIHLKHILQGYVIAIHNNIKCDHLERDELIKTLAELGHDSSS